MPGRQKRHLISLGPCFSPAGSNCSPIIKPLFIIASLEDPPKPTLDT